MPGLFGIVPLFSAPAETESADRIFAALAKSLKTHREDSLESWKILDGRLIVGRIGRPIHRFKRHPPHRDSDGSFSVAACSMAEVALAPGGRLESTHPYAFFSQVVWEAETRTFSVTVDKCASFPVFFKATADWLAFAPEVGALIRSCPAPEPDETAIAQMLVNGHLLGDATLATGVRRMQGGETLSVARGQVSRRRWWRFAPGRLCAQDRSADLSAEMSARIHTAVARHLEDPGDAAIFLSGGADSRAIFGYHGAVESIDQALDAIYVGRLVRSPVCRALLRRKLDAPFCARDEAALQDAIQETEGFSPLQAKDYLYFSHRLQCYLHTASYYK